MKVNCLLLTESQKCQNMTKTKQQITYLDIATLSSLKPCRFTDTSTENAMKKNVNNSDYPNLYSHPVIQLFAEGKVNITA